MKSFEVEQKYRVKEPRAMRDLLKKIGAKKISGGLESNEFFDCGGSLARKKMALRLRRFGRQATLTLKGPRLRSRFTKRLEIEEAVDYRPLKTILLLAGFRVLGSYWKKRELFKLGRTIVALDFLKKFGWFLEIEGRPQAIAHYEEKLVLSRVDHEERSLNH
jgi:predicted adenylyl cyclase CyaB